MSSFQTKRITLTFDVSFQIDGTDSVSDKEFGELLTGHLQDYTDGRCPFSVEMLRRGLEESARGCRPRGLYLGVTVYGDMPRAATVETVEDR